MATSNGDVRRGAQTSNSFPSPSNISVNKSTYDPRDSETDKLPDANGAGEKAQDSHDQQPKPHADEENPSLQRTVTEKAPVVKVARAKRRGLLAQFTLVPEITTPTSYSDTVKWTITCVVAIAAAAGPVGSAIIFPVLDQVIADLNTNATTANLSVAFYMLAMAIFPLWWSSFSETFGRRNIYVVSFAMYILFSAISAISKNIAMLVVFRMLAGGAAASVQAVGAGTIADVWEPFQRGRAMSTFYLGPLLGPLLAPIIGGVLGQPLGWRSTQWAQAVWGGIVWLLVLLILPETLKTVEDMPAKAEAEVAAKATRPPLTRSSTRQSVHQKSVKMMKVLRMTLIDPLSILKYLQYMPVLLTVYYASVTFGILYVLNVSIQYTFEKPPYNFSTVLIGLAYLPNSLGYLIASLFGGRWIDYIMAREARKANRVDAKGRLILIPEDRMRENAWLGAIVYPGALIWYGWTADKGVFWLVPLIANFFYGVGSMLIFAMALTMLTEFMPKKASAGVALNNFVRNILSCIGAIVGVPLVDAIGNGWLFTILGLWALLSSVVIWAMRRYGPRWRETLVAALD